MKSKSIYAEDILDAERKVIRNIATKYAVSDEYDQDTAIAQINAVMQFTEILLNIREQEGSEE